MYITWYINTYKYKKIINSKPNVPKLPPLSRILRLLVVHICDTMKKLSKGGMIHYPNLKTILMVEKAIKTADNPVKRSEIKNNLKKKIMHQTLNVVLQYLEERNMILDTHKGIIWLDKPNSLLVKELKKGITL